ncbi:hypothetical protein [Nonomuraea fuscirosea]|uniref:hypothetical protein n=1 Tax=Nonomuraea fuscirosea TaxID=1291556 RepID=UPI00343DEDC9
MIGPDALRAFGKQLAKVPWRARFTRGAERAAAILAVLSAIAWVIIAVIALLDDSFGPAQEAVRAYNQAVGALDSRWRIAIGVLLALFFVVVFALPFWYISSSDATGKSKSELKSEGYLVLLVGPVLMMALIAVALFMLPWVVFIYGLCLPGSRGLAFLLDRTRPAHPARWLAVVLFVVGFHFDFLAT